MSLAIDTNRVTRVLLADGWHQVADQSFDIDAYEYVWDDELIHGGGNSGVCASGFAFHTTSGTYIAGPLTAILAIEGSR